MYQRHYRSAAHAHTHKNNRFKPQLLWLCKTDGQVFTYRYCLATVSVAQDSERIYVSVDRPLSNEILNGLLSWFGMDMNRTFSRYRCIDNSRYYVQSAA